MRRDCATIVGQMRSPPRSALLLLALLVTACSDREPAWPDRTIKIEIGSPVGAGPDALGHAVAAELSRTLKTEVVIENRPGKSGVIATTEVAHAPADGYTLLIAATGAITLAPLLDERTPYAAMRDICPIALLAETPHALLVTGDSPDRSVQDLVARAKRHPDELTYASLGSGSSAHAIGALFADLAHVQIAHVPYRSSPPALRDLLGEHVSMMFGTLHETLPSIRSGHVRALAISSPERVSQAPDVPTFRELGMPELTSTSWYGLFAPCGLPRDVEGRLQSAAREAILHPAIADALDFTGRGSEAIIGEGFADFLREDREHWREVIPSLRASITAGEP